jgi:hypothetical protein
MGNSDPPLWFDRLFQVIVNLGGMGVFYQTGKMLFPSEPHFGLYIFFTLLLSVLLADVRDLQSVLKEKGKIHDSE